jgi:hypothetical protein
MIEMRDAEYVLGLSEPDISRSACMSRPILDVKLRLSDGQVVTGRSRNVPGTLEHLYNEGLHPNRYVGSYKVRFGYRKGDDRVLDEMVEVEVNKP